MALKPLAGRHSLKTIQMMRGFAAIAVVALHTDVILSLEKYGANNSFHALGRMGWLGVNFFFVLSGFIILHVHAADIGKPKVLGSYLYRRVTRLYPVYWVVLVGVLLGSVALPLEKTWTGSDLLVAFTLLPLSEYPSLPVKVAWTLLFEMRFYLLFCVLILSKRVGLVVFAAWGTCLLLLGIINPISEWTAFGFADFFNAWNLNFLAGMAAAWMLQRLPLRFGGALLSVGLAMLCVLSTGDVTMPEGVASFGFMTCCALAFGLLIVGCALVEMSTEAMKVPRALVALGDASYSIYLVHSAAISVIAIALRRAQVDAFVLALFAFVFAIGAGLANHLLIERPLMRLAKRFDRQSDRPSLAAGTS
jgi:peptidoglycan/LPS O-acetylase OafA/YrhL